MTKCLDIQNWRLCTQPETLAFYEPASDGRKKPGGLLVVRWRVRPVDVYSYLRARFGQPNGLQTALRRDDSDNWIHWDFNLKVDDVDIHVAGTSREIHLQVREEMTDEDWKNLILAIKRDYVRLRREKSAILRSFEKYAVFQNKFVVLADLCAELHEAIVQAPPYKPPPRFYAAAGKAGRGYKKAMRRVSQRAVRVHGDSLKLRLLTPIMAEAFINMLILTFCRSEVRNDREAYDSLVRSRVPERIARLSEDCDGFRRPVDKSTDAYGNFMRVINKRNFALHGNVNPVSEQIEIVYFEGKRPLYNEPGNHVGRLFETLENLNTPAEIVAEYEAVHIFLLELLECLTPNHRKFFEQVITDPYPGFELKKKRVTRLFPNHVMMGGLPGVRDDNDLRVIW